MSHLSRTHQKKPSRARKGGAAAPPKASTAVVSLAVFVAAVIFTFGAIGFAGRNMSTVAASGGGTPVSSPGHPFDPANAQHTCGFPGLPACPANDIQWIPLKSSSAGDIIAAAKQSDLFTINASGQGDTMSLAKLGNPELVLSVRSPSIANPVDYYLIPVLDSANETAGVAMLALNPAHTAIHVADIVQYSTPRPAGTISLVGKQSALNAVSTQRHIALRANTSPYLIYFPANWAAEETGKVIWVAGGAMPYDPLWCIPGANGQDYVVGTDHAVYTISQLPVASNA
ncbi:MAG: hypothetical protein OJF49_002151 [Ktedonobacterales bacterium]|nr:MAG: hypothetical protein OJF49_002151 [Ktedonobacterales bacterium]